MRVERRSELVSKREEVREGEKAAHIIVLYSIHTTPGRPCGPSYSLTKLTAVSASNE